MNNNQNSRGILLASFITSDSEEEILAEVENIAATLHLSNNMIFVLRLLDEPDKKVITYNALIQRGEPLNSRLFTMRIHRKKTTNTLYTINALNAAVAAENDGQTGKHLKLVTGPKLVVHPVEVLKIYRIETE